MARVPLLLLSGLDKYEDFIGISRSSELPSLSSRIRGTLRILFQNQVYDLLPLPYSVALVRIALYPHSLLEMRVVPNEPVLQYKDGILDIYLTSRTGSAVRTPRPSYQYPRGTTWLEHDADTIAILDRIAKVLGHTEDNPRISVHNFSIHAMSYEMINYLIRLIPQLSHYKQKNPQRHSRQRKKSDESVKSHD